MLVALGANDTMGRDQEGVCSSIGGALKSNCLIHNFSWGWSVLTHSTTRPGRLCNRLQFGWRKHWQRNTALLLLF